MSKPIPFESLVIGDALGPVEQVVHEGQVRDYCRDWDDPDPLYLEGSSIGSPVVPPAFLAGLTGFSLLAGKYDTRATIGAKTAHENLRPIPVGSKMITKGRIAGKYIKRGLEYVIIESESTDDAGEPFRRSRDHILLSFERVSERDTDPFTWDAAPSPAAQRAGAGRARLKLGDEIAPTHKTVFQRALAERDFSEDSSHNDDYAKTRGYPGALVSAYVLAGYVSELMVKLFGESWLWTGRFSLSFVGRGVQQGDPIDCRAVVTGVEAQPDGTDRVHLDVWIEKDGGVKAVIGTASGVLRELSAGDRRTGLPASAAGNSEPD